jgi:hypothetical protein
VADGESEAVAVGDGSAGLVPPVGPVVGSVAVDPLVLPASPVLPVLPVLLVPPVLPPVVVPDGSVEIPAAGLAPGLAPSPGTVPSLLPADAVGSALGSAVPVDCGVSGPCSCSITARICCS